MSPSEKKALTKTITFRLTAPHYERLKALQQRSNCQSLGELVRSIVQRERIICYYEDASQQELIASLSGIRAELNAIGINVNQVTRYFHSQPMPKDKFYSALKLLEDYQQVRQHTQLVLQVMDQLSAQWSQK
ncbi:hypothetical protein LVD15_11770 [Fulvivirga maritima]|uniref:plasmid mobilization protein n=1 Tax=Fulvivirga maritima TaxID=2904247 RepID=UPI001F255A1B|nr:hypothetical protein [Fulvivirga maritima]UII29073.1 hypothetical protein LVD15_11770 [Fulvivirga maritima]